VLFFAAEAVGMDPLQLHRRGAAERPFGVARLVCGPPQVVEHEPVAEAVHLPEQRLNRTVRDQPAANIALPFRARQPRFDVHFARAVRVRLDRRAPSVASASSRASPGCVAAILEPRDVVDRLAPRPQTPRSSSTVPSR
jgi:hypothetical protein